MSVSGSYGTRILHVIDGIDMFEIRSKYGPDTESNRRRRQKPAGSLHDDLLTHQYCHASHESSRREGDTEGRRGAVRRADRRHDKGSRVWDCWGVADCSMGGRPVWCSSGERHSHGHYAICTLFAPVLLWGKWLVTSCCAVWHVPRTDIALLSDPAGYPLGKIPPMRKCTWQFASGVSTCVHACLHNHMLSL